MEMQIRIKSGKCFIDEQPKYFDATDALAVALCHHYQTSSVLGTAVKGLKGWDDFIAKNPERIKK